MLDIQKTIQFCGDSFCVNTQPQSYLIILANKLNAKIVGTGKSGSAHEHAFRTYKRGVDYTVFCWTQASRLFMPNDHDINFSVSHRFKDMCEMRSAAYNYYIYLHDDDYQILRQSREFYWFDNEVLSKDTGKIIHAFGFDKTYSFKNGLNLDTAISKTYRWHDKRSHDPDDFMNHLSPKDNELFADYLYSKFTDELLFA